jgi:hypothetical protein
MSEKDVDVNTEVKQLNTKVAEHDDLIAAFQAITTLGFIVALITLAGVIIAFAAFVSDQVHQTNQQTQLLQQIEDKVNQ